MADSEDKTVTMRFFREFARAFEREDIALLLPNALVVGKAAPVDDDARTAARIIDEVLQKAAVVVPGGTRIRDLLLAV